eukprot:m.324615 g.324615  ORF g.324615 m.324615 type:complete len:90 (-) comp20373_c0_seq33:159-428(-)
MRSLGRSDATCGVVQIDCIYQCMCTPGIRHAVWLSSCLTHGLAVDALWVDARTDNMSEWRSFQQWQTGALDTSQRAWIDCATYACDASC